MRPPEVLDALDGVPRSSRNVRVPSGSGARPLARTDGSGPHRAPTLSDAHAAQTSEPELQAIADMNEGGDPEAVLVRETRKKNLAVIVFLIVLVLGAVLGVLIGTGIMVPGPDAQ